MAVSSWGVNSPVAVKLWSRKLSQEALKQTWMYRFIGNDDNALIQLLDDTQKGPGDRITVPLRMQLTALGVQGDSTLEGNEEALQVYTDNLFINQLRNAVRSGGKMSEQRVPFSVREQAQIGLSDWYAGVFDLGFFNQLAGATTQPDGVTLTDTRQSANNTPTAPSTNNVYYANGVANDTQVMSATASNVMKLTFIDFALQKAKLNSPCIRPIKMMGEDYYVLFLHPYQITDLRINTNAGQWFDIQKAAMTGGEITKNPIFTGAMGMYNNVIIHESTRVPQVNTLAADTNWGVYRGILAGAQAAVLAFGQDSAGNKVSWVEELFDYGNQLGVAAGMIWGGKKTVFNSQDFGVIVISTSGAAGV